MFASHKRKMIIYPHKFRVTYSALPLYTDVFYLCIQAATSSIDNCAERNNS